MFKSDLKYDHMFRNKSNNFINTFYAILANIHFKFYKYCYKNKIGKIIFLMNRALSCFTPKETRQSGSLNN